MRGKGIGTQLCSALADEAERRGVYKLLGKLFPSNMASARLVRRCGFREVGLHLCHGSLDGEWRDVLLVERLLGEPAGEPRHWEYSGAVVSSGKEWSAEGTGARWLGTRPRIPRWEETEAVVLDDVIGRRRVDRVLDLGTGNGHMLAALREAYPGAEGVGIDISSSLLAAARQRFDGDRGVRLIKRDLARSLPGDLDSFDVIVSALAIHHLPDDRKRSLYAEAHASLRTGGVFCNVDVVAAPTRELHRRAQAAFGFGPEDEHPSDQPAPLTAQLEWLDEAGFANVDCHWKWLELAVLGGEKP
jgi:SAM-dependent methyltransferase